MGIYVRRGLEKDFDPEKMKPGEWAVSIDSDRRKQKIWMCFAPGIVKRMGTYEDFEDQIQDATEEIKQQYLTAFNEILTQIESDKNTATEEYAYVVQFKELLDSTYRIEIEDNVHAAATSASNAQEANVQAQTYMDNAQTYMNNAEAYAKEAKTAASSITGALKPKGTVTFANLPALSTVESGAMYNISTAFISNSDFKDGGNITYPAGTNVYKTEDGMWDCLAGQLGDYLMKDDIDTAVEESMPDYTASAQLTELVSGEKLSTALGKLKTAVKNVIALIKLLGSTDISKIGDGSVTGVLSTHEAAISALNSNIGTIGQWKMLKDKLTITANTTVGVPEDANEIYVYCHSNLCSLIIPVAMLTAAIAYFNNGYYGSASNNGQFVVNATKTYIILRLATANSATESSTTYTVLYR